MKTIHIMGYAKENYFTAMMIARVLSLIFCLLFSSQNIIYSQNHSSYEMLTFKRFLAHKVAIDTNFIKELYRNVKYPARAKDYHIEGMVEVMLINHNEEAIEIIEKNPFLTFKDLEQAVKKAVYDTEIDRKTPFITTFKIYFDLGADWYRRKDIKKFHLGLIDDEILIYTDYIIPSWDNH